MKKTIEELEKEYKELIYPPNFVQLFKDMNEFKQWARLGSGEDLEACITEFKKYELYEWCAIMQQILLEEKYV